MKHPLRQDVDCFAAGTNAGLLSGSASRKKLPDRQKDPKSRTPKFWMVSLLWCTVGSRTPWWIFLLDPPRGLGYDDTVVSTLGLLGTSSGLLLKDLNKVTILQKP